MSQPVLSHEEWERLNALSDSFAKRLILPIPSTPTPAASNDPPPHHPVQQSQLRIISGLKLPNYVYDFYGLVFGITYKKFLARIVDLNPTKTLTRPAAENAWKTLIRQKYKEWSPDPKRSGEEKKELLKEAMAQVNWGRRFDVKKFWTRMYLKKGQEMRRVEEARKKEKTGVKMVERVGGDAFSMELQMRLKPALGADADLDGDGNQRALSSGPGILRGRLVGDIEEANERMGW